MRSQIVAALLLATALPVAAQMPTTAPGMPDPSRVVAGRYKIDSAHSQVLFSLTHLGFSEYAGQFVQPTGSLTLDPKNPSAAKVEVSFPIAKVLTTDPALNAHLQKPEFFDSAKFPEGKFVSTKVIVDGTTATITGDLTLKGVTKPVTLKARFVGAGPMVMGPPKINVGFAATTTISRSEFGISYGVPLVGDRVDLTINAAFAAE